MNNPLEFILRKQKMAQGGRIGFFGGGGADMGDPSRANERASRGYGLGNQNNNNNNNGGSHGGNDPQSISAQQMMSAEPDDYGGFNPNIGGGGPNQQPAPTPNFNIHEEEDQTITPTVDVTPEVKEESFIDKIFGNIFTKKTAKQDFIDKVEKNPKLTDFVKTTYGIESLDDITDAQVNEINDLGNLSFGEIRDYFGKLTGQAIDDPLGTGLSTGYNALTGSTLGFQGISTLGMMNALANIAMEKPAFAQNLDNMDQYGNYIGPMSTNTAVNQQISDMYGGLTESQMAQAVSQAMADAETGGNLSFGGGGDGPNIQNQQNTEQQQAQNFMDSLTESEQYKYSQLIQAGYTDDYAKAYLGLM